MVLSGKFFIAGIRRNFPVGILAATIISAFILDTTPANAQTAACIQLQNQLSFLSSGGTRNAQPSARYRQYDRAVKDQQAQINKTRRMARRNSCNANFFGQRNSSTCGRILSSLDQMSNNLAGLEQERRRLAPRRTRASGNERRSIIRAMNQRGCFTNNSRQQQVAARPRSRSLVEQIFGVRTFSNDGRRRDFERPDFSSRSRGNTYRTMCVRKKDGYYFPISFSTTPDRFEFDERVCQSKCPSADVALYYHAMPAQDSEDMVSYRGQQPYADLPSAFAYRKKFDPEAICRYTSGIFDEIAGSSGENTPQQDQNGAVLSRIGKPIFRTDRALDPESVANVSGSFSDKQISQLFIKSKNPLQSQISTDTGRNVRVVGPVFFPVQ